MKISVPKPIVQIGDPVIRRKSNKVASVNTKAIAPLIRRLVAAMRKNNLVGIAAPQIGIGLQVFATEIRRTTLRKKIAHSDRLRIYINPKIISLSKERTVLYEGCGSLAHAQLFGPVERPRTVTVKAVDEKGRTFVLTVSGLLAKVIQHEYDHLQGVVCIDKFTDTKKIISREAYLKK